MKLAVISGGSRGLGEAIAKRYLDAGFQVLEFSRSAPHAFSAQADFSDPPRAVAIIARELALLAKISFEEIVVVSNAGTVVPIGPASRKDPAEIITNLAVNVTSAILFISEAIRQFQDQACRKTVVQITSGAALKAYFGWSLYCSAKAGMETFIRTVALEQEREPHPFQAISIDPGIMDTEMQGAIRTSNEQDFPDLHRFLALQESGALRPASEVAQLVAKIVSQNTGSGLRYSVRDFTL
jgi:benzil reductase ((S)-benzoin forming)